MYLYINKDTYLLLHVDAATYYTGGQSSYSLRLKRVNYQTNIELVAGRLLYWHPEKGNHYIMWTLQWTYGATVQRVGLPVSLDSRHGADKVASPAQHFL